VPQWAMTEYQRTSKWQISASYGLFRSMTGVGSMDESFDSAVHGWAGLPPAIVRTPVVVIEGTQDKKTWHEIEFRYKPGDVNLPPRRTAPHQPRLDWQMWFAALGSYSNNPWLLNLMDKIFDGVPEVIDLLDTERYPFKDSPPVLLRASLMHYDFTRVNTTWARRIPAVQLIDSAFESAPYWQRQHVKEYIPQIANDGQLKKILKQVNVVAKKKQPTQCTLQKTEAVPETGWHDSSLSSSLETFAKTIKNYFSVELPHSLCQATVRFEANTAWIRHAVGIKFCGCFVDMHVLVISVLMLAPTALRLLLVLLKHIGQRHNNAMASKMVSQTTTAQPGDELPDLQRKKNV